MPRKDPPAVVAADRCRVHLADVIRRDGGVIPFKDLELAGMLAATIHFVRLALHGITDMPGDPRAPISGVDMYAFLPPDADWKAGQVAMEMLGAVLVDEPPFGGTLVSPPMEFGSEILLRVQVGMPEPAVDELRPRLATAMENTFRELVARDVDAVFVVERLPTTIEPTRSSEDGSGTSCLGSSDRRRREIRTGPRHEFRAPPDA